TLPEVRVAGVDIARGVDDRNDGIAQIIATRISHLGGARMMAERSHVTRAEPAVRSQLLGFPACSHGRRIIAAGTQSPSAGPTIAALAAVAARAHRGAQRLAWRLAAASWGGDHGFDPSAFGVSSSSARGRARARARACAHRI